MPDFHRRVLKGASIPALGSGLYFYFLSTFHFIQKHRGCIHNQTFTVLLALLTHNDHACSYRM